MNIGQVAKISGVSAKMVRYYERIGLIRSTDRSLGNYRRFGQDDLRELQFIRTTRALGFSVEEIAGLLDLWRVGRRADDIVAKGARLASDVDARLAGLQALRAALDDLVEAAGEGRVPPCPTLAPPPVGPPTDG